ncbi:MAG: rod shape-determining protein [Fusobacteriaceae bacterium]|jgi:cell division protein FtsA|nr:rod shape-determining protein [Fusobacteriaceae bacterium]
MFGESNSVGNLKNSKDIIGFNDSKDFNDSIIKAVIDIGNSKIKGIIGEMINGYVSVLKYVEVDTVGIVKSEIENDSELSNAIARVLDRLKVPNKTIDAITIGLGGNAFKTIRGNVVSVYEEKKINEDDIEEFYKKAENKLLKNGEKAIHREMYNIKINENKQRVANLLGHTVSQIESDVYMVYIENLVLKKYENIIKNINSKLKIEKIMANGYASAISSLRNDEKNAGVIFLDIGDGVTDIAIFKNKKFIFFDNIKVGALYYINEISKLPSYVNYIEKENKYIKTTINIKNAVEIFEKYIKKEILDDKIFVIEGITYKGKYIKALVDYRSDVIAGLVKTILGKSGLKPENMRSGIVITGGALVVDGLAEIISEKTGYKVRKALPIEINGIEKVDERMGAIVGLFGEIMQYEYLKMKKLKIEEIENTIKNEKTPENVAVQNDIKNENDEKTQNETNTIVPPLPPEIPSGTTTITEPNDDSNIDDRFREVIGSKEAELEETENAPEGKPKAKSKLWTNIKEWFQNFTD